MYQIEQKSEPKIWTKIFEILIFLAKKIFFQIWQYLRKQRFFEISRKINHKKSRKYNEKLLIRTNIDFFPLDKPL